MQDPLPFSPASSNSPGRILFVASDLGKNGITVHVKTLLHALLERGYSVAIATAIVQPGAPLDAATAEALGAAFHLVPFPDLVRGKGGALAAPRALVRLALLARAYRPTMIHAHGLGVAPYACVAAWIAGAPLVGTCHAAPPVRVRRLAGRLAPLTPFLNSLLGERVVAVSSEMKHTIAELWRMGPERLRVVFNGCDETHFRPPTGPERCAARQVFHLDDDEFAIAVVARLDGAKRHDLILRAAALLRDWGIAATLLIAGEGPRREAIEREVALLGLDDYVHMIGFVDPRRVLWAADALALPSAREAFGVAAAEAMLCGVVPVRTPASGATDQIEHGVNGYIVPFGDAHALALALRTLAEEPELRARMAQASLARARTLFTVGRMVENLIETYESVRDDARAVLA